MRFPERALVRLPGGANGVRVTLRYVPRIMEATRREKSMILRSLFQKLGTLISEDGGQIRVDTLLVSRQTCQALLPLRRYEILQTRLIRQRIRIEQLFDWRQ